MKRAQEFEFFDDGLEILSDLWPSGVLQEFEEAVERRADWILEALKIEHQGISVYDKLRAVEANDKERFYALCSLMGTTLTGARLIASDKIKYFLEERLRWKSDCFFTIPAIFWNDLRVTRLQYGWHQESSYYGSTWSNVLNLWAPLFRDLTVEDGPMYVLPGSHREGRVGFTEYREPGGVLQLEIAEEVISKYDRFPCALKRGEAVMFHQNLIHCTGPNIVPNPRVSLIIRFVSTAGSPDLAPPIRSWNPPREMANSRQ